jgi:hypothetical protein
MNEEELMIHVKRILVPADFSEPSKKAVNYGLSLALEFEARSQRCWERPQGA